MATWTPPTEDGVPPTFPPNSPEWRANPLGNRLMSHYGSGFRPLKGKDVFILTDGTVTEDLPGATYNSDGTPDQTAWERVALWLPGGHAPQEITSAQATILTNAGYGSQIT